MKLAKFLAGPAVAAALFGTTVAAPVVAAEAPQGDGLLHITESKRDLEAVVAKALEKSFKLKTSLLARDNDPEDLYVLINFTPDPEKSVPAVNVLIDTQVIARDKDGKPALQVVRIGAWANQELNPEKEVDILRLVNRVNREPLATRAYVEAKRIVIANNEVITTSLPLQVDRVLLSFSNVMQTMGAINKALNESDFLIK